MLLLLAVAAGHTTEYPSDSFDVAAGLLRDVGYEHGDRPIEGLDVVGLACTMLAVLNTRPDGPRRHFFARALRASPTVGDD